MKLSKLFVLSISGLLLVSCGDKKDDKKTAETASLEISEVTPAKIDSVSYAMGVALSGEAKMIKNRLGLTGTKLNNKAYFAGFNNLIDSTAYKFPIEKQEALMGRFSKFEGDLVKNKKKSTTLNISEDASIKTLMDSVSYCLGVKFASGPKAKTKALEKDLKFKVNADKLKSGYATGFNANDSTYANMSKTSRETIIAFQKSRVAEVFKSNKLEGEKFLAENKEKDGVKTTASGLQYIVMKEGKGEKPAVTSTVKVHYHGTLLDSTVFDSSVDRKEPAQFPLDRVIKGWTEGVQLMTLGSKYKFFIPYALAYGEQGGGPKIKPFSALVFEVELLEIISEEEIAKQKAAQQAAQALQGGQGGQAELQAKIKEAMAAQEAANAKK